MSSNEVNNYLCPPPPPDTFEDVSANVTQLINHVSNEQNILMTEENETPSQAASEHIESENEIPSQAATEHTESYGIDIYTSSHAPDEIKFIPGEFKYVKDTWSRDMLVNAWQAITVTELWDFVKQDIETFMFSSDPRVYAICKKMEELGYGGHSGSSFGWTMRTMQYIATHGEEEYMNDVLAQ